MFKVKFKINKNVIIKEFPKDLFDIFIAKKNILYERLSTSVFTGHFG